MTIENHVPSGQGRAPLPDVDLRQLFGEGEPISIPRLAEAGGVFFLSLAPNDRAGIAYTVERLINLLDAMDGDENLEATGDEEPSLGWPSLGIQQLDVKGRILPGALPLDDDREQDNADWEDGADDEPALGWTLAGDFGSGATALTDECEDVCEDEGAQDDREPDVDGEPFLGWSEDQSMHGCIPTGNEFPSDTEVGDLTFDGDGTVAARKVLRNLQSVRPDIEQEYVGGFCTGSWTALKVDGLTISSGKNREKVGPDEVTILRPGVAMIGGYRETAARLPDATVVRAFEPREEGMIPEIDLMAHYRAVHGVRP